MQTINLRYLFGVFGLPVILLGFCSLIPVRSSGQLFSENIDQSKYYFGIVLAYNNSHYKLDPSSYFLQQDSVLTAVPLNSGGFDLGIRGTYRLTDHVDIRFAPIALIFSERNINYGIADGTTVEKQVESVLLSFPLHLVLNSDRIGNFRVYAFGGLKYDYDLNSNAAARKAEDMIKLAKHDWGYETGIGFHIYFQAFVLSPEIKISNGFRNILVRNPGLIYSDVIQTLKSRMVMVSLNIE